MTTFPLRYSAEQLERLGYEYVSQRNCKYCETLISFYDKPNKPILVLEEATMQVHVCEKRPV